LQRVFFNQKLDKFDGVADANRVEKLWGAILVAAMLIIGLYPTLITDVLKGGISPISALFGG
jgi:NADH:ubiquinone oxidoreductase subunit 4 (subunit M)